MIRRKNRDFNEDTVLGTKGAPLVSSGLFFSPVGLLCWEEELSYDFQRKI